MSAMDFETMIDRLKEAEVKIDQCPAADDKSWRILIDVANSLNEVWNSLRQQNREKPFHSGTKVIYTNDDLEEPLQVSCTILGEIEGWYEVQFADRSTAIVRPSRLLR